MSTRISAGRPCSTFSMIFIFSVQNACAFLVQLVPVVQVNAFLRMLAASPEVHYQLPGDLMYKQRVVVLFQYKKSEVYAGAGINGAVSHKQLVVEHLCLAELLFKLFQHAPVRGALAAIQQAGPAQYESPDTYRTDIDIIIMLTA